jgi:hypothetical protein
VVDSLGASVVATTDVVAGTVVEESSEEADVVVDVVTVVAEVAVEVAGAVVTEVSTLTDPSAPADSAVVSAAAVAADELETDSAESASGDFGSDSPPEAACGAVSGSAAIGSVPDWPVATSSFDDPDRSRNKVPPTTRAIATPQAMTIGNQARPDVRRSSKPDGGGSKGYSPNAPGLDSPPKC